MKTSSKSDINRSLALVIGVVSFAVAVYLLKHEVVLADYWALNDWQTFFSTRLGFDGLRILFEYFLIAFGAFAVFCSLALGVRTVSMKACLNASIEAITKI